jgi:hypothetical protein
MKNNDKQTGRKGEAAYPLYDLEEGFKIAQAVRDLGGGNQPIAKSILAQHLKYAESGPSFFQRISSAKAFGIIDGWGSYSLTELAKQYYYPTVENGKQTAAIAILKFPKAFSGLVQKFDGGSLPSNEMIGNIIHKESDIPISKKAAVAGVFVRSARFLGAIDSSGFLCCKAFAAGAGGGSAASVSSPVAPAASTQIQKPLPEPKEFTDQEERSFYLDKDRTKQVTLNCPLFLSRAEYDRICKWIDATWIIEDEKKNE